MPALNRIQLIGYLGRDPETRITPTGKKVCNFSLAVNRPGHNEPDWFQLRAWGKLAEVCQKYLTTGRLVFVEGHLHTDRWTDDKGETHFRTFVLAQQMQMLDGKPGEEQVVPEAEVEEAAPA